MKVKVFAPATVANLASGFDILGLALTKLGDEVIVEKISSPEVVVISNTSLPLKAQENTAGKGLLQLIADKNLDFGFKVTLNKSIPLSSGLGGSASGAVGSIVGANEFLKEKLSSKELLHYSLIGESATGSAHYDNITPCLLGGVVGINSLQEPLVLAKELKNIKILIIHQNVKIDTNISRKKLNQEVSLKSHVAQSQNLMSLIFGIQNHDVKQIRLGLKDLIIEPQRKNQIPHFDEIMNIFLPLSLGGSISGSGPSLFFMFESWQEENINNEIFKLSLQSRFAFSHYILEINPLGARVEIL